MRPHFLIAAILVAPSLTAFAKKDPAKEKAEMQEDFKKLAGKVEASRKASAGRLSDKDCASFAKDFIGFSKDRKVAEGWFNAGVLYEQCNTSEAEDAYKNALDLNGNFAPAMVNLGELFYKQGKVAEATTQFERANKADPKNVQAYNDSALVLFEKAKQNGNDPATMKEAIGKLRRALAVNSDSIAAYSLLAMVYFTTAESDRSKLDLAELVCKQAKEVNAEFPQIYNTLGLIKLKKKNVTGALGEFRKAAELDPKYVEAQLNIGAITLSARDYKNAETAFKAALDAKPAKPEHKFDATMGMGVALRGQRRVDEAEKWYVKAKELDPKNCAVAYNQGVLAQDYRAGDEPALNVAKKLFLEFNTCAGAKPDDKVLADRLKDSVRRIKDIEDTFKAIIEAKKAEEEMKQMQKEMELQQKEMEKQQLLQQGAAPPAPAPGGAAKPAEAKPADAKSGDAKPTEGKPAPAKGK
ncbi:MAG: tetratricopeptide repeat protein [Myxococcales bacterium]|nr:tetratricopeptide repeat protein [Myxococcales bacterium]